MPERSAGWVRLMLEAGCGRPLGRTMRRAGCSLLATAGLLAQAQTSGANVGGDQRLLVVQPRASITQTFTNNLVLSADPISDAVTQLTAGVRMQSNSGRLRGYLDYSFAALLHAQHSDRNTHQNALAAAFGAELFNDRARIDAAASIAQAAISAFGVQPGGSGLPANNLTENRTLSIKPSFRGPLGPAVKYTAALGYTYSNASNTSNGDSTGSTATLRLEPSSAGVLGWAVDASQSRSAYSAGRATRNDRLFGTLSRNLYDLDLQLSVNAGVEATDQVLLQRVRYETYGVGATWAPSERTRLGAQLDHRFFGRSHTLSFEHRTALTSWSVSDSRNVSTSGNGEGGVGVGRGTAFDLYYNQFASIEPDPVKRTALVNSFLISNGISPTAGTGAGFLRSQATLVHSQNASVAYRGLRSAAVLAITRSDTESLDAAAPVRDDLANSRRIRTQAISLNLSHRLTPISSATLVFSQQKSRGELDNQRSSQRLVSLQHNTRLTVDSDLVVGLRRALYSTAAAPYNESALVATYGKRF